MWALSPYTSTPPSPHSLLSAVSARLLSRTGSIQCPQSLLKLFRGRGSGRMGGSGRVRSARRLLKGRRRIHKSRCFNRHPRLEGVTGRLSICIGSWYLMRVNVLKACPKYKVMSIENELHFFWESWISKSRTRWFLQNPLHFLKH
jgi:hypothetical protein